MKICKHELIEIAIPSGTTLTRFLIPEQNNLRDVNLLGIQVYANETTPYSVISQKPVLAQSVLNKCFITLVGYDGFEFLHRIPILDFQTLKYVNSETATASDGAASTAEATVTELIRETDIKSFIGQKTNWPQSYIEFSQSISGSVVADSVVILSVQYTDGKNKDLFTPFKNMQ